MSAIGNLNVVNVTRLKDSIRECVHLKQVLFIWGSFGLGKTEIVRETLGEMGYSVIDWFRGSQATPDTFAGVPYLKDGALHRAMPELLRAIEAERASGRHPAVFLDELNLSSPGMLAAMLQFLLDRRLGEYHVGEDVPIIAAGNLASDGSLVTNLPLPAANRMVHVLYEGPTAQEWLDWGVKNGVHHTVAAFIKDNPQWLVAKDKALEGNIDETGRVPTPRTWAFTSEVMHFYDQQGINDDVRRVAAIAARVGDSAASAMELALQTAKLVVPMDEIVSAGGEAARLVDENNPAAVYMQQLHILNWVAQRGDELDDATRERVAKDALAYLERLGNDTVVQFLHLLLASSNPIAMHVFMMAGIGSRVIEAGGAQAFNELTALAARFNKISQ